MKTFAFIVTNKLFELLKDDEGAFEFFRRNIVMFGVSKKCKGISTSILESRSNLHGFRFIELSESDYIEWMINYQQYVSVISLDKITVEFRGAHKPKHPDYHFTYRIINGIQYRVPKSYESLLDFIKIHYNKFYNRSYTLGVLLT